jgi:hypothetical protein
MTPPSSEQALREAIAGDDTRLALWRRSVRNYGPGSMPSGASWLLSKPGGRPVECRDSTDRGSGKGTPDHFAWFDPPPPSFSERL